VARVGFRREASERISRGPGPTDPLLPPQRAGASHVIRVPMPKQQPNGTPGKKPPAHRPPTMTTRHAQSRQRCSKSSLPARETTFTARQPSCVASCHDWEISHSFDPPVSFGGDQVSPQQSQLKPWPFSVWVLLTLVSR